MADLPNPKYRKERYLYNIASGTTSELPQPKSREERYLYEIANNGGGGGGTTNYNQLSNKPKVNNVELSGNKTTRDLIPIGNGLNFNEDGELEATGGGSGAVDSVNGKTGVVVLDAEDVGALPDDTDIPSNTSDLTNDSGFITNTVNNLLNYYLKSETYTQAEVNALISAIVTLDIQAVSTLPTENISRTTIYLVPSSDPQTQNIKDEYINLDGTSSGWELIGSTEIDLTGYVTDAELTTALADYTTTANLTTLLSGKQDTLTFDNTPTQNSNNPVKSGGVYTALSDKADASDVDDIEALIPSTATTSNKLATMDDIGSVDFDDITNRPQESDAIDIDDLDLPMPAKPTEYPVLFDETGTEYQVGLYKRADGKVKPIYRKDYKTTAPPNSSSANIANLPSDYEKAWIIGGFLYVAADSGTMPLNLYASSNEIIVTWIRNHDKSIAMLTNYALYYSKDVYVSIQYTKTTDEFRDL